MVKKLVLLLILLLSTTLLVSYAFFYFKHNTNLNINSLLLRNGDLILRCGKSTESYAVHIADNNSEFTHIGIIVIENDKPTVIHAVPHKKKRLKKETVLEFLSSNTSNYAIYRSNFSEDKLLQVTAKALYFYNNKYTFDGMYNLKSDTELYCTELILKAFNSSGINLNINTKEFNFLLSKHAIIFPSEFTKFPFKKININY